MYTMYLSYEFRIQCTGACICIRFFLLKIGRPQCLFSKQIMWNAIERLKPVQIKNELLVFF